MTFIAKPKLHHPELQKNSLGYTRRDYEGAISTLCAGCGHDSISAAIYGPASNLNSRHIVSPNCRVLAARRKLQRIFSALRTASTRCMGECRQC